MSNRSNIQPAHDDIERHAYNAAFYELGLRWHWDAHTYHSLMERSPCAAERVRLYLESDQPHLLKAYDAEFLAAAIEGKKADRCAGAPGNVNWAAIQAGQIGA